MGNLSTFVEYTSDTEHQKYNKEVKQNNLSVIGSRSESPLDEGEYKGIVTGLKNRIVGQTNDNNWCIFLMVVKVKGTDFAGTTDKIPFNPNTIYKKNSIVSFEIYKDRNGVKRGRIVE